MQEGPGSVKLARDDDREADIAARTDDHVRLEAANHPACFQNALGHTYTGTHELPDAGLIQPARVDQLQPITGFRHDILFDAFVVADIQNFAAWVHFFAFICDSERRIDMPPGTAACYNDSHNDSCDFLKLR